MQTLCTVIHKFVISVSVKCNRAVLNYPAQLVQA